MAPRTHFARDPLPIATPVRQRTKHMDGERLCFCFSDFLCGTHRVYNSHSDKSYKCLRHWKRAYDNDTNRSDCALLLN